jgi:hypothetical protein
MVTHSASAGGTRPARKGIMENGEIAPWCMCDGAGVRHTYTHTYTHTRTYRYTHTDIHTRAARTLAMRCTMGSYR